MERKLKNSQKIVQPCERINVQHCFLTGPTFVFEIVPSLTLEYPRGSVPQQRKGLKEDVLGTRPRRGHRKASQITMSESYECMETQEM